MIARLLVLLFLAFSQNGFAATLEEFHAAYSTDDEIAHATKAYEICDQLFGQWPAETYQTAVFQLGNDWRQKPDSSYYILKTCQTIWLDRYLDLNKVMPDATGPEHSRRSFLLQTWDLLQKPYYLSQEIRLFWELNFVNDQTKPPSPYSLLTGIAASEKDLNETIHHEMASIAATLSGVVAFVPAYKIVSLLARRWSQRAAVGVRAGIKPLLIAALISAAAGELVDYSLYSARETALLTQVKRLTKTLKTDKAPLPIVLDEFYKATERLGYFYSYSLYLEESNQSSPSTTGNEKCAGEIAEFLSNPSAKSLSTAKAFAKQHICADAASVWIGASAFIAQRFPDNAQAASVSARLLSRAKRAVLSYKEAKAYEATLPVCTPKADKGDIYLDCKDLSGGTVI